MGCNKEEKRARCGVQNGFGEKFSRDESYETALIRDAKEKLRLKIKELSYRGSTFQG